MMLISRVPVGLLGVLALTTCTVAACSSKSDDPTFHADVEPIVQARCQGCHHEGGLAPFPLVTYDDVRKNGRLAASKVADHTMPPWGAYDDADCKMGRKLADDLRMTEAEIATIQKWVAVDMPEGDTADAPPRATFPNSGELIGGRTFAPERAYRVIAGAADEFRCFPIDPGFTEDTWVRSVGVLPGQAGVVHHVIVFSDPNGEGATLADASGSYPCFGGPMLTSGVPDILAAWAPGVAPMDLGEDMAMKVAKGTHLVMQVHYHAGGAKTDVDDTTRFQLAPTTRPKYIAQVALIGNGPNRLVDLLPGPDDPATGPAFVIPAGSVGHTESMLFRVPAKIGNVDVPPLKLLAAATHMHWAGKNMRIEIERAAPSEGNPEQECLLGTPKYDFNWQRVYRYDADYDALPEIRAGDLLRMTCTYDNTAANPRVQQALAEQHLTAPVDIRLGETTLDEMCLGAFAIARITTPFD